MKKILYTLFILFTITILNNCKKESSSFYDKNKKSAIEIGFDNIVGDQQLVLNTTDGRYTDNAGEKYNVTTLKYFISNIIFTNIDGSTYVVPQDESYFLINEADEKSQDISVNIPEGEYNKVSFIVGVDSTRNVADISKRTGALDVSGVAQGMYWSWNSGYIFFKLEGNSTAITATSKNFQYHIGLYGGGYNGSPKTLNNIKTVSLDLNKANPKVKTGNIAPHIHLMVDINKMFTGFQIAQNSMVMASSFSGTIANNFASMFSHDHTEQ